MFAFEQPWSMDQRRTFGGRQFVLRSSMDTFILPGSTNYGGRARLLLERSVASSLQLPQPTAAGVAITLIVDGLPGTHPLVGDPVSVRAVTHPQPGKYCLDSRQLRERLASGPISAGVVTRATAAIELDGSGEPLAGAAPALVLTCNAAAAAVFSQTVQQCFVAVSTREACVSEVSRLAARLGHNPDNPGVATRRAREAAARSVGEAEAAVRAEGDAQRAAARGETNAARPLLCALPGCSRPAGGASCPHCAARSYCTLRCLNADSAHRHS